VVQLLLDLPSLNDLWKIALAVVPIGLLLAALTNAWLSARNERRRSQPVVIAHDEGGKPFSGEMGGWVTRSCLTNEGGGPAFNVRSGIEIDGHRFPLRGVKDGQPRAEGRASLWRVVRVGERLPPIPTAGSRQSDGAFLIVVDSETMAAIGKNRGSKMHWCRYENAYGQTWETRNPVDPAGEGTRAHWAETTPDFDAPEVTAKSLRRLRKRVDLALRPVGAPALH
jgi:hypothetical protein